MEHNKAQRLGIRVTQRDKEIARDHFEGVELVCRQLDVRQPTNDSSLGCEHDENDEYQETQRPARLALITSSVLSR